MEKRFGPSKLSTHKGTEHMNFFKIWGLLGLSLMATTSWANHSQEMVNIEIDSDLVIFEESFEKGKRPTMTDQVRAYDPINKDSYQKVLLGKVNKESGMFSNYDYWRYVTVYDVFEEEERIGFLPYFEEDCFDDSSFMAQWGESRSIKVTLKSDIGFAKLGLTASVGMSIEQGTTFSTARRIKATLGLKARHYPYKLSDTYEGVTYIQTYNTKTKKYGYLLPSYMDKWTNSYPYDFYLDNQNVGFKAKREIVEYCQDYQGKNGNADKDPEDIINSNM